MKDAENKDYSRDLVLRVSPSRNAFVVEEHKPGGIISYQEIDPLELYYAISGSYTSNDFLESGFLPDHCLHVSMSTTERNYIIWNPELRAVWGDRIFEKCGIRRDEEGDGGKTLEIRGKRRLSARDGGANYQQS